MRLTIYLSAEGTSFKVYKSIINSELLTNSDAATLHPVISQILNAKDSNAVLQALKSLQLVAQQDLNTATSYMFRDGKRINNYHDFVIKNSEDGSAIKFSLWHTHNSKYLWHYDIKGAAHRDSIYGMIAFVETLPEKRASRTKLAICAVL